MRSIFVICLSKKLLFKLDSALIPEESIKNLPLILLNSKKDFWNLLLKAQEEEEYWEDCEHDWENIICKNDTSSEFNKKCKNCRLLGSKKSK